MPPFSSQVLRQEVIPVSQSSPWWRVPLDWISMAVLLTYWGGATLGISMLSVPLRWMLGIRRGEIIGRQLVHWMIRIFVKLLRATDLVHADLESLNRLKDLKEPVILAPNHTSLWDALFVISKTPQPICIMKQSILANPFLGGAARLAGYIPNGSPGKMVREAAAALKEGGQLLIFPEATRTRRDSRWINPLRGGTALIARNAGVPVRPIFIRSNTRFLEKGWPLWKKPAFPIRISLELGDPVSLQESETAHQFTERLEGIFLKNLARPHRLRRQVASELRDKTIR